MSRTINKSRFLKLFIATICTGALFYGYVFYAVATGGAFTTFKSWCIHSQSLAAAVGQFHDVKLLPFDSFFEKDKGNTGLAGFSARIVGSVRTINVDVAMKRHGATWEVESVLVDGKTLNAK